MKSLNRSQNLLEFQWNWNNKIHDAYLDVYEEIMQSNYKHPHAIEYIDTNTHPTKITENGYYRFVSNQDEEFWFVTNGMPQHKTTFWLEDKRPKVSYAYSNTDLKKLTSPGAELIRNECKKICMYYDIRDYNLRLITLKQGEYLSWHKDSKNTKAAINYNFGSEATVDFMNKSYVYKTALLNIQEYHSVENKNVEDRITLKIASRDVDYDELYKRITGK